MKKTASEKQLKDFLKHKKEEKSILLYLTGQGDYATILEEPLNLCRVQIGEVTYLFGGISEEFYDKMVIKYHHEDNSEERLVESVLEQVKVDINTGDYWAVRALLKDVILKKNESTFRKYLQKTE
jgi:hypothetical protein